MARAGCQAAPTSVDGTVAAKLEARVTVLKGKVVCLLASVGEHRLKWGIVASVVGTAGAIAALTR